MPKILIVHPEGNIKDNPNLFAIAKLIVKQNWEVLVYSLRRKEIYQGDIFPGASFVYFGDTAKETLQIEQGFVNEDIRFVVGIDDLGIIKAQKIAGFLRVPYLFLSYEILFDHEIKKIGERADWRNKCLAKQAVKDAQCAIVQDDTRKKILSKEYGIQLEKILLMPVANTGSRRLSPSNYFHDMFAIPADKHVLLYMGWMDVAQEKRMVKFASSLPEDWVLVAHSRYKYKSRIKSENIGSKLFFSCDNPIENIEDMGIMLSDCQAGLCSYQPSTKSIYLGDNVRYIGLSSGKTATFLQYGIPVVVENMNIWDSLVEQNHIGFELKSSADMLRLDEFVAEDYSERATRFFDTHLDAANFFPKIWQIVIARAKVSRLNLCAYWAYGLRLRYDEFLRESKERLKSVFLRYSNARK